MPKNITVIDMQGNVYEATYPKRAKGLVKKGRARFVDENTICLACPPDQTEERNMSANRNNAELINIIDRILERIDQINGDSERFYQKLEDMTGMTTEPELALLQRMIGEREITNRSVLMLLEKMLDKFADYDSELPEEADPESGDAE